MQPQEQGKIIDTWGFPNKMSGFSPLAYKEAL